MTYQERTEELRGLAGKTVLVTGGRGMLGRAFVETLHRHVPTAVVLDPGRDGLDVARRDQALEMARARPDVILHCAFRTDVDWYEDHAEEGTDQSLRGVENVLEIARMTGAQIFYPQSFLIYDGEAQPIDEQTVPRPLNVYGRVKLASEQMLRAGCPQALTVHMAGLFGGFETDKNFVGKVIPHLAKLLAAGTARFEVGDRVWQPTYTNDQAYNSLLLLARGRTGHYCMASHGQASFFELTREIAGVLGIASRIEIAPVSAQSMARKEKAARPLAAIMRNDRLQAEGLDRQRTWQASLGEYLDQAYFRGMFC